MGRPQWETQVAAVARERLVVFQQTIATPLATDVLEGFSVYANPGTIVRVIGAYFKAPAILGAAAGGTHALYFSYSSPPVDLILGVSSFGTDLIFNLGHFDTADNKQKPVDVAAQAHNLSLIHFDATKPFIMNYINSASLQQAGARIYRILGIERQIGG